MIINNSSLNTELARRVKYKITMEKFYDGVLQKESKVIELNFGDTITINFDKVELV